MLPDLARRPIHCGLPPLQPGVAAGLQAHLAELGHWCHVRSNRARKQRAHGVPSLAPVLAWASAALPLLDA
jgi:hypothetical protein